jgi:bifunctional DNA-binding transcriptional regulator/antitoxin component of YhaV-PrlF toxin-antitoxin module
MSEMLTIQLGQRGVLTLPKTLRESYSLEPGDDLTLLDLGGVFVLCPRRLEIEIVADRLSQALTDRGETLESMLHTLREERDHYGRPA